MLVAWKFICEARRGAFEGACPRYVKFYLEHMRLEETLILPAAERCLSGNESSELDEAFASNRDPPTRRFTPDPSYERLFAHILLKAPTPIGVGEDV